MKRSRFSIITLILLAGCGYPLRVPPYLNGKLEGVFCPESSNGYVCTDGSAAVSDDTLPAQLDVRAESWSETEYTFSGTLDMDGERYTVSGKEEGSAYGQHEYLAPQASLLLGRVTAMLTSADGVVYSLEGNSRYGWGGGVSPDREEPSATFIIFLPETAPCAGDTPCTLGALRFPGN